MFMNKSLLAGILCTLVLFFSMVSANAYTLSYRMQDDATSNHYVKPPNVYWRGNCTANLSLFATASHSTSFTLNNNWYSPDTSSVLSSNPTYPSAITCLAQGSGVSSSSLNDFYEAETKTISTATSTKLWVEALYNCDPVDDLFVYSNTTRTDSFGNHPYAYGLKTYSGYGTFTDPYPSLAVSTTNIRDGIFCGSDCCSTALSVDNNYSYSYTVVATNQRLYMHYCAAVPFNTMDAGLVNVSVNSITFAGSHYESYVGYYDHVSDTKTSL